MSTLSQALAPYCHPGPGRLYWGLCPRGCRLYLTDAECKMHREATMPREAKPPLYRGLKIPLMLPCHHVYMAVLDLRRREDGTYFYA